MAPQIPEDHRIARVPPLQELARALAEINDRATIRDLYKTPSRTERHPTLELLNG
jgi:hypothetical protein